MHRDTFLSTCRNSISRKDSCIISDMSKRKARTIEAVDLFCGIGGLTKGLQQAGIKVTAGVDNDARCKYGYEHSTGAKFVLKDIREVTPADIESLYTKGAVRVLAGCAPCQSYSGLNRRGRTEADNVPVRKFAELVRKVRPEIVTMENVRGLRDTDKYPIFEYFLGVLKRSGYTVWYDVVNAADYGVPQERKRLVLLASRIGKKRAIKLIEPTHADAHVTVRDAIGDLPPIKDGHAHPSDSLHYARRLSPKNKERIRATRKNGGSVHDWNEELLLDCYKKDSGKTYMNTVYGRMRWNKPAPTMTTQCIGLGNGRFGHPTQARAISLREAAIFQSFPKDYTFTDPNKPMIIADTAKFIGNAVPVKLGKAVGHSIVKHVTA
jgi:DNA (cytosine-5)-methyltransferase 1